MKRTHALVGVTAVAAATALAAGTLAAQAGTVEQPPIAEGLVNPLQFTFDHEGRPLVAQSMGGGPIVQVTESGDLVPVVEDQGNITGVATRGRTIAYTLAGGLPPDVAANALRGGVEGFTVLKVQDRNGDQRVVADLGAAEADRNPDAKQKYGWLGYRKACRTAPPEGHAPRGGIVESNPYSVAAAPGGGWYVADAATNAIWKAKGGKLRVVSVLKPRTLRITKKVAAANDLEPCTVGTRYNFEPVPTDVEVGNRGRLYVSLLPGEGNAEGAPFAEGMGAVARVNPANGRSRIIAKGFDTATNVALGKNRIWVTELFAGKVTQVNTRTGRSRTIAFMDSPAAVERHRGKLYATDWFAGLLVSIDPSGPTDPPSTDAPR